MTYTEQTQDLLVVLDQFEETYVSPYLRKQEQNLVDGRYDDRVDEHVKFLTEFVTKIRGHIESQSLHRVFVLELRQELLKQAVLKPNGTLKVNFKEQIQAILPQLQQVITE